MQMNEQPFITVSIFLKGNQLDPDYISETLGIRPSRSQKKGEKRGGTRPNSKTYITKSGTWRVRIDNKSRTAQDMISEVPQMVGELLQMFDGRQEPLDKIAGVEEAYLDILVLGDGTDKSEDSTEFILLKEQILRISQLGIAVCATVS
jgi:hypothetical protein